METTYTTVLVARNFLEIMAQKYKIKGIDRSYTQQSVLGDGHGSLDIFIVKIYNC